MSGIHSSATRNSSERWVNAAKESGPENEREENDDREAAGAGGEERKVEVLGNPREEHVDDQVEHHQREAETGHETPAENAQIAAHERGQAVILAGAQLGLKTRDLSGQSQLCGVLHAVAHGQYVLARAAGFQADRFAVEADDRALGRRRGSHLSQRIDPLPVPENFHGSTVVENEIERPRGEGAVERDVHTKPAEGRNFPVQHGA